MRDPYRANYSRLAELVQAEQDQLDVELQEVGERLTWGLEDRRDWIAQAAIGHACRILAERKALQDWALTLGLSIARLDVYPFDRFGSESDGEEA